jgi:hypothetical protein
MTYKQKDVERVNYRLFLKIRLLKHGRIKFLDTATLYKYLVWICGTTHAGGTQRRHSAVSFFLH